MFGVVLLVGHDKGQQRHGLSSARWHLEDTVAACIEGAFEITHVCILFGVDAGIWEQDREVTVTSQ